MVLWERYVESQVDYRASAETLGRKLGEAGADAWKLLQRLREPAQSERAAGTQGQLLKRVLGEQFEVLAGQPAVLEKEKEAVVAEATPESMQAEKAAVETAAVDAASAPPESADLLRFVRQLVLPFLQRFDSAEFVPWTTTFEFGKEV